MTTNALTQQNVPDGSDGSAMAPVGVGNTETPTVAKRDSPKAVWFITLNVKEWNGSNGSSLESWVKEQCREATWQVERGDSGNLHVQLTMRLKTKNRLTWLKRHFSKIAHCEVSNNIEASFDYCNKSDTRVEGPYAYPRPVDIEPIKYHEPTGWQQQVMDIISEEPDERTIHWYWEPNGGVGKTALCKYLVLKHNALMLTGKSNDMYHMLSKNPDKRKLIVVNCPRSLQSYINYSAIEQIKDGLVFSGKYEGAQLVFNCPHVIVFANELPDESKLSADRWNIQRIDTASANGP